MKMRSSSRELPHPANVGDAVGCVLGATVVMGAGVGEEVGFAEG